MSIREIVGVVFILAGLFFFLTGTLGLLRFPDFYTRLHALTKADNLGLGFVVAGLAIQAPNVAQVAKLILAWLFVMAGSATSCYLISRAAILIWLSWSFDIALAFGILWLAWRALAADDLFESVIGFVALGLLISLAWVRLKAPDVALAEAAIGCGMTGAVLLMSIKRLWELDGRDEGTEGES